MLLNKFNNFFNNLSSGYFDLEAQASSSDQSGNYDEDDEECGSMDEFIDDTTNFEQPVEMFRSNDCNDCSGCNRCQNDLSLAAMKIEQRIREKKAAKRRYCRIEFDE